MKPKVYIETSVISYPTADVSADLMIAARQCTTRRWWKGGRKEFDCFASRLVFQEAHSLETHVFVAGVSSGAAGKSS